MKPLAYSFLLILICCPAAPAQRLLWTAHGGKQGAAYGTVVASIGDIDKDGVPDLVTAATQRNYGASGPAHVDVLSGRSGRVLLTVSPINGYPDFVGAAGDADADGTPDFLISMGSVVELHSGKNGALIRTVGSGGGAVCAVGDVDRDGHDDFAMINTSKIGVQVISGKDGHALWFVALANAGNPMTIADAGDVDRDGIDDVIVGAPRYPGSGNVYGRAIVFSGTSGAVLHTIDGDPAATTSFGAAVAGAGDIDGDGYSDFIVGAPFASRLSGSGLVEGSVTVFSGKDKSILRRMFGRPQEQFGSAVAAVGDLDRDGVPEIAVGAISARIFGTYDGRVAVFSGRRGAMMLELPALSSEAAYGSSLCGAGDIDGDGFPDFAIGAPGDTSSYRYEGAVYVISGRVVADARAVGSGCGATSQPPTLQSTRPILGLNATFFGTSTPGTPGFLIVSLPLLQPYNLGLPSCDVFVDPASWAFLFQVNGGSWTRQLTVPAAPQLAGVNLAWQAIYGPTLGPFGGDLSNGLLWRMGY